LSLEDLKHVRTVLREDTKLHRLQKGSMGEDDSRHDRRIENNALVLARVERIVGKED